MRETGLAALLALVTVGIVAMNAMGTSHGAEETQPGSANTGENGSAPEDPVRQALNDLVACIKNADPDDDVAEFCIKTWKASQPAPATRSIWVPTPAELEIRSRLPAG